jgi:hypothetical protein
MIIDKEHYLELLHQNDILRQDNQLLVRENQILA